MRQLVFRVRTITFSPLLFYAANTAFATRRFTSVVELL